jgi:hypothetical protein
MDHGEEEEEKEMISLWKKKRKAGEGRGDVLTRRGTVKRLCRTNYSSSATTAPQAPFRLKSHPKTCATFNYVGR